MGLFLLLSLGFPGPGTVSAQQHLVPRDELRQQLRSAAGARQTDLQTVREFFSSEAVRDRLPPSVDAARIDALAPFLDDAELARLAETTRDIDRDLKAGALTNQQLTYIVIALATAVIVILLT